jgi:hypothetical protein
VAEQQNSLIHNELHPRHTTETIIIVLIFTLGWLHVAAGADSSDYDTSPLLMTFVSAAQSRARTEWPFLAFCDCLGVFGEPHILPASVHKLE